MVDWCSNYCWMTLVLVDVSAPSPSVLEPQLSSHAKVLYHTYTYTLLVTALQLLLATQTHNWFNPLLIQSLDTSSSLSTGVASVIPRTKSSNAADKKDDKWTFRPFREPAARAPATQLIKPSKDVAVLIQEEIAQLRAGIYKLNQKKKLSDLDQANLTFLQTKLKALNELV